MYKRQDGIRETQVVQVAPDTIVLRLSADPSFSAADERHLVAETRKRAGPELHVTIERVDAIERGANGKFRSVVRLPSVPEPSAERS